MSKKYLDNSGLSYFWGKINSKKQDKIDSSHKISSDLIDDNNQTNKFVTTNEKQSWNDKLDSSDLTNYVTKTDYATSSDGGVVKVDSTYGIASVGGSLMATTSTASSYNQAGNTLLIGKGTLENVLASKGYQTTSNKVTNIDSSSTDVQYPSAKCVYDGLQAKQEVLVSGTNVKTINNQSILGSGNINISGGGGSTDVQINGTSIIENDVANIITNSEYNSTNNKLATMVDLEDKQDKLGKALLEFIFSSEMIHGDSTVVKNATINAYVNSASAEQMQLVNLITAENKLYLNSHEYLLEKIVSEEVYIVINNLQSIEGPDAEQYELGMERIDTTKPCFFAILTPNQESQSGYLLIAGSTETILNQSWKFIQEQEISYISDVAVSGNYNDLIDAPTLSNLEQKHLYTINGETFYYQFYGTTSLDNITVNVGVEIDVIYATYVLITQSVEELQQGYADTLYAIQHIHIPDEVYESSVLIVVIHNLGSMTCYINPTTKYVTHATFTNFANGYSVDFGTNPTKLTIYYSATQVLNNYSTSTLNTYSSNYINGLNEYSETEKRVGTWINGKPLYQKTINAGALPNNTTKSIAHNVSNIGEIVYIGGYCHRTSDGLQFPIPYTAYRTQTNIILYANSTYVYIQTLEDRSSIDKSYVTIKYTKTTD